MSEYVNLPIPGTDINVIDKSQIFKKSDSVNNGPILLAASACDKGPEELTLLTDIDRFREVYLENKVVNFNKFGLPLYLVDEVLSSGSSVYFKRIVAEDATLSNIAIIAVINKVESPKVNAEGLPLYLTPSGEETTEAVSKIENPNYKPATLTVTGAITGTTASAITSELAVTIKNDTFTDVNVDEIVTDWFTAKENEEFTDLTFKVTTAPSGDNTSMTITVEGTPNSDIIGTLVLTVPANKLGKAKEVSVEIPISINPDGGTILRKAKTVNSTFIDRNTINTTDEFITVDNVPVMTSKASVQFGAKYVNGCKTIKDVEHIMDSVHKGPEQIDGTITPVTYTGIDDLPDASLADSNSDPDFPDLIIDENSYVLPLFIITEKGRGLSNRRVRIVPDYPNSKNSKYFRYHLEVIESGKILFKNTFAFDNDYVDGSINRNMETQSQNNQFVNVKILNQYTDEFFKVIEEFSGLDKNTINATICLVEGKDKLGKPLPTLEVGGVNLQHTFGIRLSGGDHGSFGNNNHDITKNEKYVDLLESFYKGDLDENVWRRDELFFNLICDANFDQRVKRAIEYLAKTREDVTALLDMGTTITEFNDYAIEIQQYDTKFVDNTYYQYGEIINKFNNRKIVTTLPMLIGKRAKQHFDAGRSRPMAGKSFGFSFPELLTVNHTPKETPRINEKEILRDNRINFGTIQNNVFTLETNYTMQQEHTQLSYSSNVLAIQHLIQDIRKAAPSVRYLSLSAEDLEIQKEKYNSVCARHSNNFEVCRFDYVGDEEDALSKTFKGRILVVCKDFTMREEFDIFVIHRDDVGKYELSANIGVM